MNCFWVFVQNNLGTLSYFILFTWSLYASNIIADIDNQTIVDECGWFLSNHHSQCVWAHCSELKGSHKTRVPQSQKKTTNYLSSLAFARPFLTLFDRYFDSKASWLTYVQCFGCYVITYHFLSIYFFYNKKYLLR